MLILGIDPGKRGAAAALCLEEDDCPEFISDMIDFPMKQHFTKERIDIRAFCAWVRLLPEWPAYAVIENVRAMPRMKGRDAKGDEMQISMGAASSFNFGVAAGQIHGALEALGIDCHFIEARAWKEEFELKGGPENKNDARLLAITLWPMAEPLLRRKKDQNRAEAALIGRAGAIRYAR